VVTVIIAASAVVVIVSVVIAVDAASFAVFLASIRPADAASFIAVVVNFTAMVVGGGDGRASTASAASPTDTVVMFDFSYDLRVRVNGINAPKQPKPPCVDAVGCPAILRRTKREKVPDPAIRQLHRSIRVSPITGFIVKRITTYPPWLPVP
jgi:hypothetical protein